MPFLLKAHVGYADLGTFMLSTYPYSLKLLWSPIVDSLYVDAWRVPGTSITLSLGRRKSWIVPIQLLIGAGLLALSYRIDTIIEQSHSGIYTVTAVFFALIFLAATQDIAVDGWALTLLSEENVGYASTAQTVGINIGYFMSFTVFLALNSVEACNKYLRLRPLSTPILSLSGYLQFCAACFLVLTLWLLVFQPEKKEKNEDMGVREVYSTIWQICQLRHVQLLLLIHMICKIGFQANDAVTGLKLVEHGLSKEDLAFAVLIDFPFQMIFGYLVAAWSRGRNALRPWLIAFAFRLVCAAASMGIVAGMPMGSKHISTSYFLVIIASTVINSFATTVQFVGITAFHTRIADPVIGGTYMTLLNTVSNLGGTWPRYFVLRMVEFFTVSRCLGPTGLDREQIGQMAERVGIPLQLGECSTEMGRSRCESLGGKCVFERDGYYYTSAICIAVGALTLLFFIAPVSRRLQALHPAAWRRPSAAPKRA
ncbi:hypothetical protein MNAN1_000377 [Malassezia nana]|uniref:Acetyl-coenzyme A transporter 1 n=1 Tax=Malassezia nana TaxID=180528 RepID=A0AAF0EIW2_9BASI|nr:hypothetical protein MNAN1_000377 [Malassezia nana]